MRVLCGSEDGQSSSLELGMKNGLFISRIKAEGNPEAFKNDITLSLSLLV